MAELVDALDLGSSEATRACSSHVSRTNVQIEIVLLLSFFYLDL